MSDEKRIKTLVSDELYDFLAHEGIATYNNIEVIVFLHTLSTEELKIKIEEIDKQKSLFKDEIQLVNKLLTTISSDGETITKFQEKKHELEEYLQTFILSEKLYEITLKIKKDSKFSREIEIENINEKINSLYFNIMPV